MKRIDITTTQNVSIEYKAATFLERFLAWIIDIVIISVTSGILYAIIGALLPEELHNAVSIVFVSPIYLFYHLVLEIFNNGASVGKMALSIRVVKTINEPVSIYDYFMRWAFRLIDIGVSAGAIAVITISSSLRNQRIGDYLADTTVIKVEKSGRFALKRVLELDTLKKHEPQYPEIAAFSESDMLVLKEVIDRYQKYPSEGTTKALNLAVKRIESLLGIKANANKIEFLKILIKDYVALTR